VWRNSFVDIDENISKFKQECAYILQASPHPERALTKLLLGEDMASPLPSPRTALDDLVRILRQRRDSDVLFATGTDDVVVWVGAADRALRDAMTAQTLLQLAEALGELARALGALPFAASAADDTIAGPARSQFLDLVKQRVAAALTADDQAAVELALAPTRVLHACAREHIPVGLLSDMERAQQRLREMRAVSKQSDSDSCP
jgi:hypothetical protein